MRTTRTWMTGIAAVAMIAAATGCSGGSDAAPLTTVAPTTPATAETPLATEATTTTTSTTTTTTPPPTTLDRDTIKADVEAGFRAYEAAYDVAVYDLEDLVARTDLLRLAIDGGRAATRIVERFDMRLSGDQRVRPNSEIPNRIDIFSIELVDDTTAVIDYCRIDSDIVYEPDGLGQGIELIVDDETFVGRVNATMQLDQSVWKVLSDQQLESYEGASACPTN